MHDVGFLRAIRKNQLENLVIHRLFTLVGEMEGHQVSGPAAFDSNVRRTGLFSLFKRHVHHLLSVCNARSKWVKRKHEQNTLIVPDHASFELWVSGVCSVPECAPVYE